MLHAEMKEAESVLRGSRECRTYGTEYVLVPQRRQTITGTERHVDGAAAIVRDSSSVRHAASPSCRLTPGVLAPSAPSRRCSQQQLSSVTPHLESGIYCSKLASMSSSRRYRAPTLERTARRRRLSAMSSTCLPRLAPSPAGGRVRDGGVDVGVVRIAKRDWLAGGDDGRRTLPRLRTPP